MSETSRLTRPYIVWDALTQLHGGKNLCRVPRQGAEPVEWSSKTAREFVRVLKEHVGEYGKAHLECDQAGSDVVFQVLDKDVTGGRHMTEGTAVCAVYLRFHCGRVVYHKGIRTPGRQARVPQRAGRKSMDGTVPRKQRSDHMHLDWNRQSLCHPA